MNPRPTARHDDIYLSLPLSKRRAKKACIRCRERKVRCDRHTFGAPCTNCRHSGIPCLLGPNKRRKQKTLTLVCDPAHDGNFIFAHETCPEQHAQKHDDVESSPVKVQRSQIPRQNLAIGELSFSLGEANANLVSIMKQNVNTLRRALGLSPCQHMCCGVEA